MLNVHGFLQIPELHIKSSFFMWLQSPSVKQATQTPLEHLDKLGSLHPALVVQTHSPAVQVVLPLIIKLQSPFVTHEEQTLLTHIGL